ncbi:MAG: MASE1 domain-containing protein [Candidatus Thiodiazotropha sp. (ex Dulcina madagascariensis)]|nr:MASE1 domain-containing protein [Candidatus Thiodiazotropha sp. (ex Dulcina madagascariensis)]
MVIACFGFCSGSGIFHYRPAWVVARNSAGVCNGCLACVRRRTGSASAIRLPVMAWRMAGLLYGQYCLLSATWGVTTLWLLNLISNTEYPFSWINWWVGDAIGVIVFLPIVYTFFGRPAEIWQWRKKPVAIPLILATAAVIAFFIVASGTEAYRNGIRAARQDCCGFPGKEMD